ncbi:MAG: hypothetical protein H6594_12935 [Flavobacteriales bacterium]|nr:hypothetical protein [Flavobacteriales bacterium]
MARPDENTRSAIHFLVIAAVIVLALRGMGFLLERLLVHGNPRMALLTPWRNGYLLLRDGAVTVAHTTLSERLSLAFLLAVGGGAVTWSLTWLLTRRGKDVEGAMPLRIGRWTGGLVMAWCTTSAFLFPPSTTYPDTSTHDWRLVQRPTLAGELTWPWGARRDRVAFSAIDDLGCDLHHRPDVHCLTVVRLWFVVHRDTTIIGTASPALCARSVELVAAGDHAREDLRNAMKDAGTR